MSDFIPNSIQVPVYFTDEVMPAISGNAWKIFCLIFYRRHRFGAPDVCELTYRDIREGTGISSDATVAAAVQELCSAQAITVESGKGGKANIYDIRWVKEKS